MFYPFLTLIILLLPSFLFPLLRFKFYTRLMLRALFRQSWAGGEQK